ncbi:MAG: ferritin family protein [Peptococcaceae bacterium]|nr:ferritin family protein [Peptococcaceae bacterium]
MNDLDVARQAILNEEEGAAFYSLAAEKTSDSNAKDAFQYLKEQELQHADWLRSLYDRLVISEASRNLEWETLAEFEFKRQAELEKRGKSPNIFNKAGNAFKLATIEMAVFAAGILMEKESMDFYLKAAAETDSLEARKLYLALAEWEREHYNDLSEIHEGLKQQWLEKQEFTYSPKL